MKKKLNLNWATAAILVGVISGLVWMAQNDYSGADVAAVAILSALGLALTQRLVGKQGPSNGSSSS